MTIDKLLLPQSPFLNDDSEDPIEINIGPPDGEITDELTVEIEQAPSFDANLADFVDDGVLSSLASELSHDVANDKLSRKEWESTLGDGLELLGLQIEERTEPWEGACGVYHPILTEAAVRFQSEMISETFPAQGPVKARVIGEETPEIQKSAERVVADMNFHLTEKMTEFRPEHEKLCWALALAGSAFKKTYYDPTLDRPASLFVPAEDMIVAYGAPDLESAERVTHIMRKSRNELRKLQYAGFYRDVEIGDPVKELDDVQERKDDVGGMSATYDNRYKILEIHVDLDLEGFEDTDENGEPTGIALPYVVTMEKGSQIILAIRRNWDEEDVFKRKSQHFTHYQYIPGYGFYGYGLIHLVGGFAKGGTSILRQLVDSGTLSNLPGGFKTRGLRIKGDDTPIAPGEFRDVDVPSQTIRDNIMPLPYKEPSQTLFALLQYIVEEGRRLAAVADVRANDMNSEAPVGTMLAILERSLKVMSAIQARCHASLHKELKLVKGIIQKYTAPVYGYDPEDAEPTAKRDDYERVEILPVSDPNAATMAQRIIQYQAAIQLAQMAPQIYNLPRLHRAMLEVMGIRDADKIVQVEEDQYPTDPVTENMNIINGKPVKAFIDQDHHAHLQVHASLRQDPVLAEMIGQNPKASAIIASGSAHEMEHLAFQYRRSIEEQLGTALPSPETQLPPDVEAQVSKLAADAAQRLTAMNQQQVAQQKAQQQAQDPVVQMQQRQLELDIKRQQDDVQIALAEIASREKIAQLNNEAKMLSQEQRDHAQGVLKGFASSVELQKQEAELAVRRDEINKRENGNDNHSQ